MSALRRRLTVTTWLVVSAQALLLALGTVQLCAEGEHSHGGVAAPDCATHHHVPETTDPAVHASHHGHATTNDERAAGAQLSCRCSNQPPATYLGQVAVVEVPAVTSPFFQIELLPGIPAVPAIDHRNTPPSPPPR